MLKRFLWLRFSSLAGRIEFLEGVYTDSSVDFWTQVGVLGWPEGVVLSPTKILLNESSG